MIRSFVILFPLLTACDVVGTGKGSGDTGGGACEPVQRATPVENVSTTTPAAPEYGCIASFSLPASCADDQLNVKGLTLVGGATAPSEVRITAPRGCDPAGGAAPRAVFVPTGAWTVSFGDTQFCPALPDDNLQLVCDALPAVEDPWTVELPTPDGGGTCSDYGELTLTFVREQTPECTSP